VVQGGYLAAETRGNRFNVVCRNRRGREDGSGRGEDVSGAWHFLGFEPDDEEALGVNLGRGDTEMRRGLRFGRGLELEF